VNSSKLACVSIKRQTPVQMLMDLSVPKDAMNFLTNWVTLCFSKITSLHVTCYLTFRYIYQHVHESLHITLKE